MPRVLGIHGIGQQYGSGPELTRGWWEALLWLGPSLALIAAVVLYPVVALVGASFGRYSITGVYRGSVGWSNYAALLGQEALPTVLANTAVWVVAVTVVHVVPVLHRLAAVAREVFVVSRPGVPSSHAGTLP